MEIAIVSGSAAPRRCRCPQTLPDAVARSMAAHRDAPTASPAAGDMTLIALPHGPALPTAVCPAP